jgi:hypothetical protein
VTAPNLVGQQFVFDYGQIAKFLLYFSNNGEVEVTPLAAIAYSISAEKTFAVNVREVAPGQYEICWRDPVEHTHLIHQVDFTSGMTTVLINDARLNEKRSYKGCVSPV